MLRSIHYKLLQFRWSCYNLVSERCWTECIWFGFPVNAFPGDIFDRKLFDFGFSGKMKAFINNWEISAHELSKQIAIFDNHQNAIFLMHSGRKLTKRTWMHRQHSIWRYGITIHLIATIHLATVKHEWSTLHSVILSRLQRTQWLDDSNCCLLI